MMASVVIVAKKSYESHNCQSFRLDREILISAATELLRRHFGNKDHDSVTSPSS